MNSFRYFLLALLLISLNRADAQQPLSQAETTLSKMARDILNHDSLTYKINQNRRFASQLIETLKRPESYEYDFDSLQTVSILEAEDHSFRIFTWYIVDKNYEEYYAEQYHYFFGLVQRKYINEQGGTEYIVIPLVEMQDIPRDIENRLLDNTNWLGALYYPAKNKNHIPAYQIKVERGGKKEKSKVYLLMGWNGNDNRSNYKVVEALSFDPKDKNKVLFGANVFYFDILPKSRALFKYSDYAPFTLNFSYVKSGIGKLFKKEMLVYDHLADPRMQGGQKLQEVWEMGPDGSYDALSFYKRGGYFEWYRNVELAEKFNNKLTQKQLQEIRDREAAAQQAAGIDTSGGERPDNN